MLMALCLWLPLQIHAQDDDELHFDTKGRGMAAPMDGRYYYVSGDTISYFADAFLLPEGAMLDRLLRKIPGVEYSSDGDVVIDETTVKEMRIEGKVYYKDDMATVIKRIPKYCIDQVKFYDYDQGKRMNIFLKKEYKGRWFAELSAAFGPDNRYSEKVFAMLSTKKTRLTLFGNANDINDTRQPGQETEWTPASLSKNQVTSQTFGGDYLWKGKNKDATGYAILSHSVTDAISDVDRTNLLVDGNTYQKTYSVSRKGKLKLKTYHDIHFKVKTFDFHIKPKFSYNDTDNNTTKTSATTAEDSTLINRSESTTATSSYDYSAQMVASVAYKFDKKRKQLKLEGGYTFKKGQERESNKEDIDYHAADSTYNYGQEIVTPQRKTEFYVKNEYQWTGKGFLGTLQYQYKYNHTHEDLSETENGLVSQNSYGSNERNFFHEIIWKMHYEKCTGIGTWTVNAYIPLDFVTRHVDFSRTDYGQNYRKQYTTLNIKNTYLQWRSRDTQHRVSLTFDFITTTPDYLMLQDITNTSDKTTYYRGNPGLDNQTSRQYRLQYAFLSLDTRHEASILLLHKATGHGIVEKLTYDHATGNKTYTYDNADGARETAVLFTLGTPLNSKTTLYLHNQLETSVERDVSLEEADGEVNTKKTDVYGIDDDLRLKWLVAGQALTLRTRFQMSYSDKNGKVTNPIDWSCGLLAQLHLPWKLGLSTDFTMYKRHKYTSAELNSTDWVWNARLTRLFLKDRLMVVLEGFDIFKQLKNVTHTVSSDAIVNTRTNVLPSYAMLCLVYRLNYKPPRRKSVHWY